MIRPNKNKDKNKEFYAKNDEFLADYNKNTNQNKVKSQ